MILGLSLQHGIIDLGPRERNVGLTYVALSRMKSLDGVAFDGGKGNEMPSFDRFTKYYNYDKKNKIITS